MPQMAADAYSVRGVAVKQVLGTDRTGGQVSALVCLELSQAHAAVALHAMSGILAQSFPHTTDIAEWAVVDVPPRLIIKQVTDVAEVSRQTGPTGMAVSCNATGRPS